jgi:DNA-binding MarR family transcriptional regulator
MLPVDCLCTLARRYARSLTDLYDRAIEPSGLKVTQLSLLRAIERLDRPSLTSLADATGLDRSTLGRNLRVLERSGLIMLVPGDDERTRVPELTTKARQAVAMAKPLWDAIQQQLLSAHPKDPADALKTWNAVLEQSAASERRAP